MTQNVGWMVTIVGLIGIVLLLLLLICHYLGGEWTSWTRAWLTSSREEKMILTRGGQGQYHPNGFMIPSDSDLNISGGGSFRRFDRTIDYQLLRQGSTVSIPSSQKPNSNIPPQPLRPAPILPVVSSQSTVPTPPTTGDTVVKSEAQLEQQSSVDSVFLDEPVPLPPRIPPPKKITNKNNPPTTSQSSYTTTRALPSFSMTNPFLPLLQASTQFFSQTLQGLQSFQYSGTTTSTSQQPAAGGVGGGGPILGESQSQAQNNNYGHNSYTSTTSSSAPTSTTTKLSMGELLFSAPPSATIVNSSPPALISDSFVTKNPDISTTTTRPCEFIQNSSLISDFEASNNSSPIIKRQSSNPFSPQSSFTTSSASSFDPTEVISTTPPIVPAENIKNYQQDIPPPPPIITTTKNPRPTNIFNWTSQIDRPTTTTTTTTTNINKNDQYPIPKDVRDVTNSMSEIEQLLSKNTNSIFDEIRDFNQLSMSRNEKDDEELIKQISSSTTNTTTNPISLTINKLEHVTKEEPPNEESGVTDNRDGSLKGVNINSTVTSTSGGHYTTPYRNARSFSLRQTSTDSIGSMDGDGLTSPDASLPSLQRAMSCDSVCSNSSVSELPPPQLAGQLCIGLEYDSETADLLVNVIEAKEINIDATASRSESNFTGLDTYVRVYLLPDKTTNMQTRVYRKSLNPIYKEKFMFGLELAEFPIRSLVFYMYATDKFSNTLMGEAELKLGELNIYKLPSVTWLPLTDTGQRGGDLGEIMFSLSYLPTAERLTVVVVKGRNLKFPRETVGDPFVKVYLLQRGKKVSKKKSSTKRGEKNPIFNEAMIFGVPAHALQTIQLRITVADSAEAESNRAYSIGHVIVGSAATGKPLSHWNQMLSSLRKPIAMWHSLRK